MYMYICECTYKYIYIYTYIYIYISNICIHDIKYTVILEKSSGGEYQARNSSGMVYPHLSH